MTMQPTPQRQPYSKPWLSLADQVQKLDDRGLTINDRVAAEQFLSHLNYYRFSGYCLAFETARHQFQTGCTFEHVKSAYEFDTVLRDVITEALEVIEVDFRTVLAYHFGETHGAFGHTDPVNFHSSFRHNDWLDRLREEAERSSEQFVDHFRATYSQFPDLPIWMAMEVMSFGALSKMYHGMLRDDQKKVAGRYGTQPRDLTTVMHHLVYVRNLCAHHSRLWDRVWAISPSLPHGKNWQAPLLPSNNRLFATLLLLYYLMNRSPELRPFAHEWKDRVKKHLNQPPEANHALTLMGMPANWAQHPLWT